MYCPFRDCLCIPAATSLCCNSECLQKCLQLRWIASTGLIWSSASSEERIGHRETRACFAIPSHGNLSFWLWVDDVQVESLVREVGGHALVSEGLLTRGQRPWRGIWRAPNSLCGQRPEGRRWPQGARGCRRRSGAGRVLSTMAGGGGIEQQTVPSSGRSRQDALWSAMNKFLSGGGVGVFVLVCLLAVIGVWKKQMPEVERQR